jgi:integrase
VTAIIAHCETDVKLKWLGHVIAALVHTGLRISELASLKWGDLDEGLNHITLTDEHQRAKREKRSTARSTKNHRDRTSRCIQSCGRY